MDSLRVVQVVHMATIDTPRHAEPDLTRFFHVKEAELNRKASQEKNQVNNTIEEADDCSYAPTTPPHSVSGETEVPECPLHDSDNEEVSPENMFEAMVTRQVVQSRGSIPP